MATLQATSLIDCLYIPDFIASGTKMVFNNATTPTSWTKDTTYNNYTFRVVNGSVSTGGENPFSSLMSSTFPISGTVTAVTSGAGSVAQRTLSLTLSTTFASFIAQQSAAQTPPHTHTYSDPPVVQATSGATSISLRSSGTSNSIGDGLQHSHNSANVPHTHTLPSPPAHNHPFTETGPHSHASITGTQNFAVNYIDVILASKD